MCYSVILINKILCAYIFQVVGHSLGGGTAALLTYILREQKEFSSSTCVTFAPGIASCDFFFNFVRYLLFRNMFAIIFELHWTTGLVASLGSIYQIGG